MGTPFNPFDTGGSARPDKNGPGLSGSPFGGPPPPPPGYKPSGPPPFSESTAAPTSSSAGTTFVSPPTPLLLGAIGIAAVGIVLGAVGWNSWLALVGWALAGPVAIGIIASFVQEDAARRADPNYLVQPNMNVYYFGAALSAVVGIVVTAVGAALWVGHL